jgi:hypothetical protein
MNLIRSLRVVELEEERLLFRSAEVVVAKRSQTSNRLR